MVAADRIFRVVFVSHMKNNVILYHARCGDGFGAAWVAHKKFGNRAQYIALTHDDPLPKDLSDKNIFIIDFSFSEAVMQKLLKTARRVVALDHHISAAHSTKLAHEFVYDLSHSGAVLAWNYFFPKRSVPQLLKHIEDIDLWKFRLLHTREIIAYINSYKNDFTLWNTFSRNLESASARKKVIAQGKAIVRYERELIARVVHNAKMVTLAGCIVYAVNSSVLSSEIGNTLVKKRQPFSIVWSDKGGVISVSLRAQDRFDVSRLAKRFGGGGHKNAAGFSFLSSKPFPWKSIKK